MNLNFYFSLLKKLNLSNFKIPNNPWTFEENLLHIGSLSPLSVLHAIASRHENTDASFSFCLYYRALSFFNHRTPELMSTSVKKHVANNIASKREIKNEREIIVDAFLAVQNEIWVCLKARQQYMIEIASKANNSFSTSSSSFTCFSLSLTHSTVAQSDECFSACEILS